MSYPDSVQYLYALGNEMKGGAKLGLARMQTLLAGLGYPEKGGRFVHVAGTNGKGSTSAMLASALQCAGETVGLYTSPHLAEPTERIAINGTAISRDEFAALFAHVHRVAEQLVAEGKIDAHPSYFETVTAMALLCFKQRCSISVVEVGLGGRLDATNVIQPLVSVITPVAFDHEAYLGNTLASIAFEKAGILKPGTPAVIAEQHPEAQQVIEERAAELACTLIRGRDVPVEDLTIHATGSRFRLQGDWYECHLAGRHQLENARTAILAAHRLNLPLAAIQAGIAQARWPGRLELVSQQPDFILDGAHNPAGAAALTQHVREFYYGRRPIWLVYGAMRDKAIDEVTEQLFPLADRLLLTAPDFPRALRPQALLEMTDHPNAQTAETVADAIAIARTAPPEAAVFFSGSLFLVGEARALLVS